MLKRTIPIALALAVILGITLAYSQAPSAKGSTTPNAALAARGKYLVEAGGCNDCHTPWIMGPKGPEPDMSRMLSGHPADMAAPEIPAGVLGPNKWGALGSPSMTAWGGPWGISFSANLTPDEVTGTGAWTEAAFIKAMRTGKHLGAGRDILPPMPWYNLAKLNDEDLKAVFAFLRSIKPISNQVPQPLPPAGH
jgi:mono/diheme cytochrome c family protein